MSLTTSTTRNILGALVLCFVTSSASAQLTETNKGGSTIRGTVVYADTGRRLRFAGITLLPDAGDAEYISASDKRGEFVFKFLPAGRYVLTVYAPGILQPENFRRGSGPIIPQLKFSERSDVYTEVNVNGTDSVEVKVQAIRGGVITGRVLTEGDQPLARTKITLFRREGNKWAPVARPPSSDFGADHVEGITDASGVYRLAGLRAGDYIVRTAEPSTEEDQAGGADEAYGNGLFMVAYHPSATNLKEAQAVTVVEGSETTGVDIRMTERAPHTLTATVTFGPTKDPAGRAEIVIKRKEDAEFEPAAFGHTAYWTDAEGKWRLSGLPPGEYLISIGGFIRTSTENYFKTSVKRSVVRIHDEAVTELNVNLSPGAQVDGNVVFNDIPVRELYKLSLQLVDDRRDQSGNESREAGNQTTYKTYPQPNGRFVLAGMASGNYRLAATTGSTDYYVKSVTRKGVDLMQAPIKLAEGESFGDIVITLATDLARVEAQVKLPEKASQKLLADMLVIVAPANDTTRWVNAGHQILQPDAEGRITFKSAPGEYFVAVLTPAQVKKLASLDLKHFEKDTGKFLRIKLRGGERVKGLTLPVAGQ